MNDREFLGMNAEEWEALPIIREKGLKDNEIAVLVNAITRAVLLITKAQATRQVISNIVVETLERMDLRIDKPAPDSRTNSEHDEHKRWE